MNAAVYARVSTDEQAREGQSLSEQQRLGRERASADQAVTEHVYVDQMSGSRADRPGYQQMLADAAAGAFEILYVWKFDRLGRDAEELLRGRRMLEAAGVKIVSLTEGEAESTLVYGVRALVAQEEREKISERTRVGLAAVARTGRSAGGQPPLGYRIASKGVWAVDKPEAVIVRRIDELFLAGLGVNRIVRTLNADGVRTRRGRLFCARVVLDILDQPAYLGLHRFKGELHQGAHAPIRSEETWRRIQALRLARKTAAGGGRGAQPKRHLLTRGLLRCPCGAGMAARTFPKSGDYYVCVRRHTHGPDACSTPTIRRDAIDAPLLQLFESHVLDVDQTVAEIRGEAERLIAEARLRQQQADLDLARADEALARVRGDYLAGAISAADWQQLRRDLAEDRAAATAESARHAGRALELDQEADRLDAEEEFAGRIAALRQLALGGLEAARDTDALRAALTATFERFDLQTVKGAWLAVPRLRADRRLDLARTPAEFLLPARRMALSGSETRAPEAHSQSPLIDALFAPIPVEVPA